jgi:hypothetical protein
MNGINEPVSRVREITRYDSKGGPLSPPRSTISSWPTGFRTAATRSGFRGRRSSRSPAACLALLPTPGYRSSDSGLDPVIVNGSAFPDPEMTHRTYSGVAPRGRGSPSRPPSSTRVRARSRQRHDAAPKTQCRTIALQSACCAGLDAIGHGAGDDREWPGRHRDVLRHRGPRVQPADARVRDAQAYRPAMPGPYGDGAALRPVAEHGRHRGGGLRGGPRGRGQPAEGLCLDRGAMPMATTTRACPATAFPDDADGARQRACQCPLRSTSMNAWGPGHTEIDAVEAECLCNLRRADRFDPGRLAEGGHRQSLGGGRQHPGVRAPPSPFMTGRIPPTVNWETPDPECPLNLSGQFRDVGCSVALVNSHGLGGTNASMVLFRE